MQTNKNNNKVKQYVPKYKDNARSGRSVGAYGGNNPSYADAGKLKSDKFGVSKEAGKLWKKSEEQHKDKLKIKEVISSGAGKAFIIFAAFVILDYFFTIFAIRQHFGEFNPLTVSIYENFQNPEMIFLFFKAAVIALNGLLVYLLLWLKKSRKMFGKIALAYALLAAFFAFVVVVYDVGIITGAFVLPEFANNFIFGFFKFFGMI